MKTKIKWFKWSWFALTMLFLFFRLQNIMGVFTPNGVIINDTDPYYRLHRIDVMLNEHHFYPLHDTHINSPDGMNVSWPLGLDLLVALPLKLYDSKSHAEIESFAAIVIPFLSLPLLWFSGWVGTALGGPLVGLLIGLLVSCSSTLVYQTGLGRLDHHFLEASFPVILLMFLLKFIQTQRKFTFIGIILILGLAPSFVPAGWVIGGFMAIGLFADKGLKFFHNVSKIFFYSFLLSLIPLSFSDRFFEGMILWGSFSWWTPFFYICLAFIFKALDLYFEKDKTQDSIYKTILVLFFICTLGFLFHKNQTGFIQNNIIDSVRSISTHTGTMATTLEARSVFDLSLETWFHSDTYILLITSVCFLFFLLRKKHLFILGFSLVPIVLSFFQVRFMAMGLPLCFIIIVLFFYEWFEKLPIKKIGQGWLLAGLVILLIIPFRPYFGLLQFQNSHYYFQPIRNFSFFLNSELKKRNIKKEDQAIIAHWDYGHWLLHYTGLPVVADPFQGGSAYEVLQLFTSKGTHELDSFIKKHPAKYLVIESGAYRSFQWLKTVHKNTDIYFDETSKYDGNKYFSTTPAFENLFMYRFFFELGLDENNNHPDHWRLFYISPFLSPNEKDISSLKVFEHVPGFTIHAHSKKSFSKLYLQATLHQQDELTMFQQIKTGKNDFTWTVPYGTYDQAGITFDGVYKIYDETGRVLFTLPTVTEDQILKGDTLKIQF